VSFQATVATGLVLLGRVQGLNALRDLLRKLKVTEPVVNAAGEAMNQRSVHEISSVTLTPALIRELDL